MIDDLLSEIADAVRYYWEMRSNQADAQQASDNTTRGQRAEVLGGQQMDSFAGLVEDVLVAAGVPQDPVKHVIWYKIGNASLEAGGNARFLGKPYEPGAVIKNDIEYILLFRKPGGYRSPSIEKKILSTIEADRHQRMFRQLWDDITGEKQKDHPAPFPVPLAERLIRMFSFVGDTVVDPFAGTGSTAVAASRCGRHSVSIELEEAYVDIAEKRIKEERGTLTNYENLSVEVVR